MSSFRRYVSRHHVALLALFFALGGTSLAAVNALPRNSVGSPQIRNRSIQKIDLARRTISSLRGARGPQGLQGVPGVAGAKGDKGDKGDTGSGGAPAVYRRTRLHYTGSVSDTTVSFTYELHRTVGTFTKDQDATAIRLAWSGIASMVSAGAGSFCEFELRVDGKKDNGSSSTSSEASAGGSAIVYSAEETADTETVFTGLPTGTHTVSIWLRGSATSCHTNYYGFGQDVFVDETA
jgi:hypothetical protein